MNERLLDRTTNDLKLVTNADGSKSVLRSVSWRDTVVQRIGCILNTVEGECFVDYKAGVPWFESILGNSVLFGDEISQEIKDKILEIDGVANVQDVLVEFDGRNMSGRFKVVLSDGTVESGRF